MKSHIITLAGRPGSGKSSTAKLIAGQLGYQHFSSGDLFRSLAKERGIELLQANLSAKASAELDRLVDNRLQEIGKTEDNRVIDSRMAWHWIPDSFKVFLDLDLQIAADRILRGMDDERLASEHIHRDPEEYADTLQRRLDSETARYKALYHVNPYDISNYDLVIDTAHHDLDEVVQLVLQAYRDWLNN